MLGAAGPIRVVKDLHRRPLAVCAWATAVRRRTDTVAGVRRSDSATASRGWAVEAARSAAERAGVAVREVEAPDELRGACRLLAEVWGTDEGHLLSPELARALSHAGSYLAVAESRAGSSLEAVLTGFLGTRDGELYLHSHVLGVLPSLRHRGIGFALKLHQRAWALQRGLRLIAWTFDPLVARNAYFNVAKLGGEVVRYYVDFYGPMTDAINRGDESDRVLLAWRLDAPLLENEAGVAPDPVPALTVGPDGGPERRPAPPPGSTVACHVPPDIDALRADRPDLAARWRREVRAVLGGALAEGRRVAAVTRDGRYLLNPPPAVA
jgi:predicted GNAT superfamily acetyltransferase